MSRDRNVKLHSILVCQVQDVGAEKDAITSLRAPTHFGRPNWDRVFGSVAEKHPDTDVGVVSARLSRIGVQSVTYTHDSSSAVPPCCLSSCISCVTNTRHPAEPSSSLEKVSHSLPPRCFVTHDWLQKTSKGEIGAEIGAFADFGLLL